MIFFRKKNFNTAIFSKDIPLFDACKSGTFNMSFLYLSKMFLLFGLLLILLNNLQYLAPGTYFGSYSWVTLSVFSLGLIINFISIPTLYFSSFNKFKNENEQWDTELFWILPMFFFGTYYLYGSDIQGATFLLVLSVIVIISLHLEFILDAKKLIIASGFEISKLHRQYLMNLEYLSAYYIILVFVVVIFNPLQNIFIWIRLHF